MRITKYFSVLVATLPLMAALMVVLVSDAAGQRQTIRLRGAVRPNCTGSTSSRYADIYAEGTIAVQGSYGCRGAFIYNLSNPDAPALASWYNPGANQQFLEAIVLNGRGYFGSGNGGGVHIVDLSNPASPVHLGTVTPSNGGGFSSIHEMNVIVQNGSTLLIENDNFNTNILRVINVTNPASPVFVRNIVPQEVNWVHAMHIRGDRMYTSGWGTSNTRGRTEIWNISNLTTQAPTILGFISDPSNPPTNGNNMHSSWTSENGAFLFSAREDYDADIRVYDIQNPAAPVLIHTIRASDYGLNAISPHNPVVRGNVLYVAWYQAGIQAFDIRNPYNPVRVGDYDTFPDVRIPPSEKQADNIPWDVYCGGADRGQVGLPETYGGNWAVYPFLGSDKVLAGDLKYGLLVLDARNLVPSRTAEGRNGRSDFDGDGRTDLSVFRPTTGTWHIESTLDGSVSEQQFGTADDVMAAGDYDGDGRADRAVFRPSTGVWYLDRSTAGFTSTQFGIRGDIPVANDYDADGRTDMAVFRPSTGTWYIEQSVLGFKAFNWGVGSDIPVTGDFEGDGKADIAVYRPSTGAWHVLQSSSTEGFNQQFGTSGDIPVSADFDGNGVTDFAVFRPSTGFWYILDPVTAVQTSFHFGTNGDVPVPADFDGDLKFDLAVFRPSTGEWYRVNSSDGNTYVRTFGVSGDRPSPSMNRAE